MALCRSPKQGLAHAPARSRFQISLSCLHVAAPTRRTLRRPGPARRGLTASHGTAGSEWAGGWRGLGGLCETWVEVLWAACEHTKGMHFPYLLLRWLQLLETASPPTPLWRCGTASCIIPHLTRTQLCVPRRVGRLVQPLLLDSWRVPEPHGRR